MDQEVINTYLGDSSADPIDEILSRIDSARNYNPTEVGLYHPTNSSIVKIRDNGMIDIFVATNQGIRIDPGSKSINFFTNHQKHHIGDMSAWIEYSLSVEAKRSVNIKTLLTNLNSEETNITGKKFNMEVKTANLKADSMNLDVPEESLILAGKSMKQVNTELKNNADMIAKTRQEAEEDRQRQSERNNSVSSSIESLWSAISSIGGT